MHYGKHNPRTLDEEVIMNFLPEETLVIFLQGFGI
jgi:hypothetical protein